LKGSKPWGHEVAVTIFLPISLSPPPSLLGLPFWCYYPYPSQHLLGRTASRAAPSDHAYTQQATATAADLGQASSTVSSHGSLSLAINVPSLNPPTLFLFAFFLSLLPSMSEARRRRVAAEPQDCGGSQSGSGRRCVRGCCVVACCVPV
jgi:hypothetical protein